MYFLNIMHILLTNKVTLYNGQSLVDHYVRKTAFVCLFVWIALALVKCLHTVFVI